MTRESVAKKARVGADMDVGAIDELTNAKLEVDRSTERCRRNITSPAGVKSHLSLRQSPKAAGLKRIRDKRVHNEVYEDEADGQVISGKWVLKTHKARYVLRGFEEDVKDEDVFASTTMTASVRMLPSLATDFKDMSCSAYAADMKTAFLNASMKDGDEVCARPPEWQPESLDQSKGTVIWKL